MALVEVEDLRVYVAVVRERSLSRAATRLRLSQPSVSTRIGTLERRLRTRLLDRGPRGTTPTPAGETFLAYAQRCLDLLDEAVGAVRAGGERYRLALAAPASVGTAVFPWLVTELAGHGVDVACRTETTAAVYERLRDGTVQAGFVLSGAHPAGIAGQPFLRDPMVAVVAAAHPLRTRRVELADLHAYPVALYDGGPAEVGDGPAGAAGELPALLGEGSGGDVRPVQPVRAAVELALRSGHVAVVPWSSVAGELADQRLRRLPVELPGAADVHVAWRRDRAADRAVAAFTAVLPALREALRGDPVRRPRT